MVSVPTGAEAASFVDGLVHSLMYIAIVLVICAILGIIAYRSTFKTKVRLRYLTGTNDKIKDCCGKLIVDRKDNVQKFVVMWKLFKTFKLPAPPSKAVSLTMRGKDCVEIEIPTDGTPRYIVKEVKERTYKPFDSNDKVFFLNEHEKIAARKKKGMTDVLIAALPFITLIIIFVAVIAFWGDIVKPFNEAGKTNLAIQQENAKITGMLKEIIKEEQRVYGEVEIVSNQKPQNEVLNRPSNVTAPPD